MNQQKQRFSLHNIIENAAEKAAIEILKNIFLFIFSTCILGILGHIVTSPTQYLTEYVIVISISFVCGAGYLITTIILQKKEFDYRIIEKRYEYKYESKTLIKFTKTFTIKALTKTCDRLLDRYNWSGSGKVIVECANKNFSIIMMPRTDNYQRIEVNFGRTLQKGECITVVLEYTLHDPLMTAIPFLCSTIVEPTDLQVLTIKTPVEWHIKDAIFATRKNAEDHHTTHSGTIEFVNGVCTWEVKDPQQHTVYSLKWDFE